MFSFIAIFLPSALAVKIIDYLNKGISNKNAFYYYIISLIFSSCFNNVIIALITNLDTSIIDALNIFPMFFTKYLVMSIVLNIVLALIFTVLKNNISFGIEVEGCDKFEKNK